MVKIRIPRIGAPETALHTDPLKCAQHVGAISVEKDGETKGLDSCPLECELKSIPCLSEAPFTLF